MKTDSVLEANRLRWDPRYISFYENYSLRLSDKMARWGLCLNSTFISKKNTRDASAHLEMLFIKRDPYFSCLRLAKTYSLVETDPFHSERFFTLEDNYLSVDAAKGMLSDQSKQITWDLLFEDPSHSHCFEQPVLNLFFKNHFLSPRLAVRVSGSVIADHHPYRLERVKAYQSHRWGVSWPRQEVWGYCNTFAEDDSAVFEGWHWGQSIFLYFCVEGQSYCAYPLWPWRKVSRYDDTHWQIAVRFGNIKFEVTFNRDPREVMELNLTGFQDEKTICKTGLLSACELKVFEKRQKEWVLTKTLTSLSATFENRFLSSP